MLVGWLAGLTVRELDSPVPGYWTWSDRASQCWADAQLYEPSRRATCNAITTALTLMPMLKHCYVLIGIYSMDCTTTLFLRLSYMSSVVMIMIIYRTFILFKTGILCLDVGLRKVGEVGKKVGVERTHFKRCTIFCSLPDAEKTVITPIWQWSAKLKVTAFPEWCWPALHARVQNHGKYNEYVPMDCMTELLIKQMLDIADYFAIWNWLCSGFKLFFKS